MRFSRLPGIVGAALVVLTSVVSAQNGVPVVVDSAGVPVKQSPWGRYVAPGPVPKGMVAVTVCQDGAPIVHFRREDGVFTEEEAGELWAHEQTHIQQLTRDSSLTCEQAFAKMVGDPVSLVKAEAEAYCNQAWYLSAHGGIDPLRTIAKAVQVMSAYLNGGNDLAYRLPLDQVAHLFMESCPLPNTTYRAEPGTFDASGKRVD